MKKLLMVAALVMAGCTSHPSLVKMTGAAYRVTSCYGEEEMVCSRMMRHTCPSGFMILNPSTAESKGPIFMCSE